MKNPTLSIIVFGVYLLASGLSFIFIPNVILPLLGLPTITDVWIRVVGLLAAILGYYFLYSVRYNDRIFYRATIYARLIFFTGIACFVLFSLASPLLLAFGLIDLAGAGWTWYALRGAQ